MPSWSLLSGLATALGVGLLIGTERGWRLRDEPDGQRVAGLRTFGLLGLLGGICGLISFLATAILAAVLIAGIVAVLLVSHMRDMSLDGHVDATSMVAALLTLALGVLVTIGYPEPAVAAAAVATLILALRDRIHSWVAALGPKDVQATAQFAIISAVILPLLPDARYGPFGAWNPRELWLVVVLVTGFSFAAYIATKVAGARRGTLVTAAVGGLYSSTAVTAGLAQRIRTDQGESATLAAGIALASALMFLRVLVMTAVFATSALPSLALAVGPAAVLAVAMSVWLVVGQREAPEQEDQFEVRNPFELLPALGFATMVAAMALAVRWAESRFGEAGVSTLIVVSGSFDVDAAIVTMGGLPVGTIEPWRAGVILAGPVLLNTLFKAGVALALAGWRKGLRAALPLLVSAAAMAVVLTFLAF